jgi:hypothetical protein
VDANSDSSAKAYQAVAHSWARQYSVASDDVEEIREGKKKRGYQGIEKEVSTLEAAIKRKEEERGIHLAAAKKIEAEIASLIKSLEIRKKVVWGVIDFYF